jgi:hypothetical protein
MYILVIKLGIIPLFRPSPLSPSRWEGEVKQGRLRPRAELGLKPPLKLTFGYGRKNILKRGVVVEGLCSSQHLSPSPFGRTLDIVKLSFQRKLESRGGGRSGFSGQAFRLNLLAEAFRPSSGRGPRMTSLNSLPSGEGVRV